MTDIASKVEALGLTLPEIAAPAAAYVPSVIHNNQLIISGQLPFKDGSLSHMGKLGDAVTVPAGQEAAQNCALNILALIAQATKGDVNKVERILKLEILVNSTANFTEAHLVANGASNLLVDVFGQEKGSHARAAYSVASLPLGAAVEITATVALA